MEFLGRLHPLVLHLPIGFLLLAFLMEGKDRWSRTPVLRPAISFALSLGMWSAILAAGSGYFLSQEGGYDNNLLFWHQWLGVFTALLAVVVKLLHTRKASSTFYFPVFSLLILVLTGAGHYGGSLTHGTDFLTAAFDENEEKVIVDIETALVFEDFIQPIFKKKCVGCHKASKSKGELLLTSIEEMRKGGESGALFVENDAANSLFLQRIHLPMEEEEHMPPEGKTQLTEEEITLLEWWVNQGAETGKTVVESEVPENIQAILKKYATPPDQGVLALEVNFAKESHLIALENAGFEIQYAIQEKPFVTAVWRGQEPPSNADLKLLKKIDQQLVALDMRGAALDAAGLKIIGGLPHLEKLSLQHTNITNEGVESLNNREYLSYLNLYGTAIDDEGLQHLKQFTKLQKLFLWQTQATEKGVAALQEALPNIVINTGADASIFGESALKDPEIITAKELFVDTVLIALKHNFPDAQIYFTLDGSRPDSNATLYKQPILLRESTEIQFFAHKKDWKDSEIISKVFPKVGYEVVAARLSNPPAEQYAANGEKSLFDLKKGTLNFRDGKWLGYEGKDLEAVLDLGKVSEVNRITVSALADSGSYIFFPKGLEVSTSVDGKQFQKVSSQNYQTPTEPVPLELKHFSTNFQQVTAQFVKVKVKSQLKNPQWHPAPGAPSWVFVDEILVE